MFICALLLFFLCLEDCVWHPEQGCSVTVCPGGESKEPGNEQLPLYLLEEERFCEEETRWVGDNPCGRGSTSSCSTTCCFSSRSEMCAAQAGSPGDGTVQRGKAASGDLEPQQSPAGPWQDEMILVLQTFCDPASSSH